LIVLKVCVGGVFAAIGKVYKNAFANPKGDPTQSNVLLIGASILIENTAVVRGRLDGKADVFRIRANRRYAS